MIEIELATGSETERQAQSCLISLLSIYDLRKWEYSSRVRIEDGAIAHSHPVLTLHSGFRDDPDLLLADYIHEQLHWFDLAGIAQSGLASREFRSLYPELPTAFPLGAGSDFSTYLHIPICALEFGSLSEIVGEVHARQILGKRTVYTAIYQLVLSDWHVVREVLDRFQVVMPERPPAG